MINKTKNSQYFFLILTYFIIIIFTLLTFGDVGIHIEEKFHRINGLYWLNYISQIFNFEKLTLITDLKMKEVDDYTLSSITNYKKYGIIFDLPVALLEILFDIEKIENIYLIKHFLSFLIFLISSFFFYLILIDRFNDFFLSFSGTLLFITTPRIFGDSFFYKDILFLSFFTIALYFFLKTLNNFNIKNILFFSLFTAISFNLRIFGIFLPISFLFLIIIKNFTNRNIYYYLKYYFSYLFVLIFLIIFFSPYLWSNPFFNFLDIFIGLKRDLIDPNVKILFNGEFVNNRNVPETYLLHWIFITTPILIFVLFLLGYFFYLKRFVNRFINIKEKQIFYDLWRGQYEKKDFVIFFLLTSFYFTLLIFNAPFYNGWRLVYFLHIFIIYFTIYQIDYFIKLFKKNYLRKMILSFVVIVSVMHNIWCLVIYHPYQSYYFTEFISNKKKNNFEGDYHGISGKHFFLKLSSEYKGDKIKVAVASHTPLHRSLESINEDLRKNFQVVGQEYKNADFIYKNNIHEVNSNLNKKYNIPVNFAKIYELNVNGVIIYEIFKNTK